MNSKLLKSYISILLFSAVVLLIHWLLDYFYEIITYYSLGSIYAFHILSALVVAGIVFWVQSNSKDHTGFAFMGTSLLKMLAAILFLLPGMLSEDKPNFSNILNFFIPYFLYLIFEAVQVIKLINAQEPTKTE
ncbi:DUF6168 family protein [Psychroflexus tropicus]|uniref:DUF6168 family protein n=1 Tax=Psychroflexus tropicus TaxID=197345 RepID=UPI00036F7CFF|nr:DUF6168 family protein [Psychroflexus tropicus]